jgi:hypothetical protein
MTAQMVAWYLFVPVVTLVLWVAHARESWHRPTSMGPFGWLLLIGLPLALVGTMAAFAVAPPDLEPKPYEAMPRSHIHDGRLRLLILGAELFMAWVSVLVLEAVLSGVRSSRRMRAVRPAGRSQTESVDRS